MVDEIDDLKPILWKWFVRCIWIGSIAFFQYLELHRYLTGQTYRPFFGLYCGVLFALLGWVFVWVWRRSTLRHIERQAMRRHRSQRPT